MGWSRRRRAAARTIALGVGLLLGAAMSLTAPTAATAAEIDGLADEDCPVAVPASQMSRVACGALVVPESRATGSDPDKTIEVPVMVISSTADDPLSDPLVFPTAGGPGAGTLSALWYFLDYADWASDDRDIILIEQRGDALADPTLDCPELDIANSVVEGELVLSGPEAEERRSQGVQACHDRLIEGGVDLAAYTSAESAADLQALRAALGYDEWNLYGVSYGARLAMTVMRDQPEGLRSVILDGAYPPNVNRFEELPGGFVTAVDALLGQCAASPECHEAYPDLEQSLTQLLETTADEPIVLDVDNPADGSTVKLELHDTDLAGGLYDALYDPNLIRALPFLIDRLASGGTASALPLAQQAVDNADRFTEGLDLSVECAEEAPFNDDARIAEAMQADPILAHFDVGTGFRSDCAAWAVPALAAVENEVVTSDIPTLLTSGGYDPVTPLAYSEAAAEGLSVHYLYEFPTMGHGSVWQNWIDECPASIAGRFLDDPTVAPDSSCIAAMPPTDFLTSDDIYPTTAIYRFDSDVIRGGSIVQIGIPSVILIALVGTLVYAIIYGVTWLFRRRGDAPGGAVLAAATAAALFLAYAAAMMSLLMNTNPLILGFGLPPGARPLVIAPLVAIAVTILLTVVMVRAWIAGDGSTFHRVVLSISAGASIAFAVWLIVRGLLIL